MDAETLQTYNKSALQLAEYFKGIGPRVKYIERAMAYAHQESGTASVLEIGCGDGRDAVEIAKRSRQYLGIDYSESLIELAKHRNIPNASFDVQDMIGYEYPANSFDVVFAFASLLHLDKASLQVLFPLVARTLRTGGIFYVSTKYASSYKAEKKVDQFGPRLFYFYSESDLNVLSNKYFQTLFSEQETHGHSTWIEMAFLRI